MTSTLVVGYGNPLRGDDGLGPTTAQCLIDRTIPRIDVIFRHQLNVELIEDLKDYSRAVLIDAGEISEPFEFRQVREEPEGAAASTHHLKPEVLLGLLRRLYPGKTELFLCTIQGKNFEMGAGISAEAAENGNKAAQFLEKFLCTKAILPKTSSPPF